MDGSHSLLSDSSLALRCRNGAIHPIIRSPRRAGRAPSAGFRGLRGPEVDHQLEFGRLHNWQVGWLFAKNRLSDVEIVGALAAPTSMALTFALIVSGYVPVASGSWLG